MSTLESYPAIGADRLWTGLPDAERAIVAKASDFAASLYSGKLLSTGEGALDHALGMTACIADLDLDGDARAAGLLYAVPSYLADAEVKLTAEFNATVAQLVKGVTTLNALRVVVRERGGEALKSPGRASQLEVLRKMFLAMVEDVRVVLLRLASRTQTLRYLTHTSEGAHREIARETLEIYAPLANRLGVWNLKWELEDLSLRFLDPDLYKSIAIQIDERRGEREAFIAQTAQVLTRELAASGVRAQLSGRPKHIFSIWNKMRAKNLAFEELYDVRGIRVLVDEVKDCYTALGIVHNLWQPIPKEFDDYISRPKGNYYRSLHTAVICSDGRALEVQIRTHEMHNYAELGVAAHWCYKEGAKKKGGDPFDDKIAMLRQMLAWRDEVVDSSDWVETFKRAALNETVYVLTPEAQVIDLPRGSTPVDFAYSVHTGLGHRCRGAKANGAIVPLDYKLKNADRIEIISANARAVGAAAGPSRDWLNPARGFIASSRARNKVRQWFNALELGDTIAAGRAVLERELHREGRSSVKHDEIAKALDFERAEDLYAALGREEIGKGQLQLAISGETQAELAPPPRAHPLKPAKAGQGSILVVGVDRLLTQLARCCKPAPPDAITGFVTRGRGISVHRAGCASLAHLATRNPERLLPAAWAPKLGADSAFQVDIAVRASDRNGLLRDIMEVLAREKIGVAGSQSYRRDDTVTHFLTVNVASVEDLRRTLALVGAVPGVASAARR
ncbi:MAG: bifunctional (p)ppGpp synthetase/guanosine-3',5'-bis(diphosphate) 3'-pyrophosphohydrolase [Betaproteobacteria bacterium]|nr:bifunctional (p)ppGpp synthetase/guanosine-3',5'-bis(diphosphate) 3'-pyrophosphohydrolase [Betaproteobacteria bacterium]